MITLRWDIKGMLKKSRWYDEIDITPPKEDTGKVSEGEYEDFSAPSNSKKEKNNMYVIYVFAQIAFI